MEHIKEAFQKVKQDITSLMEEVDTLKHGLIETREKVIEVCNLILQINKKMDLLIEDKNLAKIHKNENPTIQQIEPTTREDIPTHNYNFKPLNSQNMTISIGNDGVPTDRQTDKQTNRQTDKGSYNNEKTSLNPIEDASKILESLDTIKREIRLKFKRLTEQEFLVFSMIYQLEEETGYTDYKQLSEKLGLTESSIRDYVGRLIKKGIPIEKKKINNKNIQLNISKNFRKIATLPTILQLREL